MAWSFVQGVAGDQAAGTSKSVTLSSNITSGNRLIAVVYVYGSGITLSQVSDNLGNQGSVSGKYDQAITQTDPFNGKLYIMTAPITVGGSCTITATATGSASFISMWVGEYSGLSTSTGSSAWDVTSGNNGTVGLSNGTGSTAPTNNSGELAIACFGDTEVGAPSAFNQTTPGGWTERVNTSVGSATANLPLIVADQTPSNGANVSLTWTCANADGANGFAAAVVTFITPPPPNAPANIQNARPGKAWSRYYKGKQFRTPLVANQPPPGQAPAQVVKRITPQPKPRFKKPIVTAGTIGVVYNSSGVAPVVTVVIQKPKPKQKKPYVAAGTVGIQYNSGSISPIVTVAIQKPRARSYKANIVVPPTAVVVVQGTKPIVTFAIQKTRPRQKPPFVSATTTGTPYNSGGFTPTVTRARYPIPKQLRKQPFISPPSPYNSGGITPIVVMVKQKKPKPTRPDSTPLPALTYNSGGIAPIVVFAKQKRRVREKKPSTFQPPYNSGSLVPIVTVSVQKRKPTRGDVTIYVPAAGTPIVAGAAPVVTVVKQKTKPINRRFSHAVTQPVIVPPGTQPIVTFVTQKRRPRSKKPYLNTTGNVTLVRGFALNLSVTSATKVTVAPGLFRVLGAFPEAIIVQFRPFRIKLLRPIDKSK